MGNPKLTARESPRRPLNWVTIRGKCCRPREPFLTLSFNPFPGIFIGVLLCFVVPVAGSRLGSEPGRSGEAHRWAIAHFLFGLSAKRKSGARRGPGYIPPANPLVVRRVQVVARA